MSNFITQPLSHSDSLTKQRTPTYAQSMPNTLIAHQETVLQPIAETYDQQISVVKRQILQLEQRVNLQTPRTIEALNRLEMLPEEVKMTTFQQVAKYTSKEDNPKHIYLEHLQLVRQKLQQLVSKRKWVIRQKSIELMQRTVSAGQLAIQQQQDLQLPSTSSWQKRDPLIWTTIDAKKDRVKRKSEREELFFKEDFQAFIEEELKRRQIDSERQEFEEARQKKSQQLLQKKMAEQLEAKKLKAEEFSERLQKQREDSKKKRLESKMQTKKKLEQFQKTLQEKREQELKQQQEQRAEREEKHQRRLQIVEEAKNQFEDTRQQWQKELELNQALAQEQHEEQLVDRMRRQTELNEQKLKKIEYCSRYLLEKQQKRLQRFVKKHEEKITLTEKEKKKKMLLEKTKKKEMLEESLELHERIENEKKKLSKWQQDVDSKNKEREYKVKKVHEEREFQKFHRSETNFMRRQHSELRLDKEQELRETQILTKERKHQEHMLKVQELKATEQKIALLAYENNLRNKIMREDILKTAESLAKLTDAQIMKLIKQYNLDEEQLKQYFPKIKKNKEEGAQTAISQSQMLNAGSNLHNSNAGRGGK